MESPEKAFEFFLARALGYGSVAAMRELMPALEFEEWKTFYRYEAWLREHREHVANG